MTAEQWKNKGIKMPVFNKNIFTIDEGDHLNCLVILHGYPTSSYDYHKVLPILSKHYRVIIHDLIGFGFSDKVGNKYFTVIDQVDYILELWDILHLENITILAHDYGCAIVKEILARKKVSLIDLEIDKLIFCNDNMPINHSYFIDIQHLLTEDISKKLVSMLASFGLYKKTMKEFFSSQDAITDDELMHMWTQLEYNNGREVINFVSNYIRERKIFWNRWNSALKNTKIPFRLIWSKNSMLSHKEIAITMHKEIPDSKIMWTENSGHFPMLESPEEWAHCVLNI